MRHYNILPVSIKVKDFNLSKDALRRLSWIDWYFIHGKNAEKTCRHFGISKSVFYRWFKRFDKHNLKSLEFNTKLRRPKHLREMTTPLGVQKRIYEIRLSDKEKSKYEIQEELKREGIKVGQTAIQKVINRQKYNTKRFHRSLGYKTPLEVVLEYQSQKGGQPFSI